MAGHPAEGSLSKEKKVAYDQTLRELAAASAACQPPAAGPPPAVGPPPLGEGSVPAKRPGEVVPPAVRPALESRTKVRPLPPPPGEPPRQPSEAGKGRESQRLAPLAILISGGAVLAIGGIAVLALVMAGRSSPGTGPVEMVVAPAPPAELPPEPIEPPHAKPANLHARPHSKRRSRFDAPGAPLPPLSDFLPKTADTSPAGADKPQGNGLEEPPAKLPLDSSNPSSTGTPPAEPLTESRPGEAAKPARRVLPGD